jgi:hypothetical protein
MSNQLSGSPVKRKESIIIQPPNTTRTSWFEPVYSLQFSYELDIFLKNKIDKRTEIVLYKNPK